MLWAQCPGRQENERGLELVGPAGELLWKALSYHGLGREDVDVQNVVRCRPVDAEGRDRDPDKKEIQCCSVYNQEALTRNQGRAQVHVILGDVAGTALLGGAFRKDKPVFWWEPWDAYIVLNWLPSYILRQGGERAADYEMWRTRFAAVRAILDSPGRWGVIRARENNLVRTPREFEGMERELRKEASRGRRISVDIEDGNDRNTMLLAGFGVGHWKTREPGSWQGKNWSVVLDHPESDPKASERLKPRVAALMEDRTLRKSLHNGSYDSKQVARLLGARLRGYDYDTMYGTYLRFSYLRSCSLENLMFRFFPELADYKETTAEWEGNFANAPLERLFWRNCGDCEITQKLEQRFSPQVRQALVRVYIDAAFTLDAMEGRGPLLDWEQWKVAGAAIPKMAQKLDRMLQHISGRADFDADSSQQVAWLVYDHLGLPQTEAGRSTQKEILELLLAESGNSALDLVMKRRGIGKIKSTYLDGFANSARRHGGELHTIWWLTGAVTGRLRSGKGDRAEAEGIINMQNLHGNPLLQNMIVSDLNWRRALED